MSNTKNDGRAFLARFRALSAETPVDDTDAIRRMPIRKVNAKSLMAPPPNRYSAIVERNTVPDVIIVRLNV